MHKKSKQLFIGLTLLSLIGIVAAGCGSSPRVKMAPGYEITPTRMDVDANLEGTPDPTSIPPTPTPEPLALDDNMYTIPSQAFSLYIPQGWTLAIESDYYVRFESPDKQARLPKHMMPNIQDLKLLNVTKRENGSTSVPGTGFHSKGSPYI